MVPPIPAAMGFAALHGSLALLAKGVDKLTQSIETAFTKSIGFGDRAQKASLELGMTYKEAQTKFAGSIEGLRGDLTTRYVGAFMALEAGLQGNTQGVAKLINQQMLTGTNYAKTAKTFARLESIAGLDRDATDQLTRKILILNKTYSVSTEVLVDALDGLSDVMPVAGMLGIGKQLTGAVTELAGIVGRDMLPELNKVVAEIMDVSIDKFGQRVMLGVDQTKQQLIASKSQTEDMRIMVDAIHTAAESVEMFAAGSKEMPLLLGITQSYLGTNIMNFKLLSDELKKSNKKQAMGMTRFFETIETLKSEILTPLFKVISEMFTPEVIRITKSFTAMGSALAETVGGWLKKEFPKIMKDLDKTVLGWLSGLIPIINFWEKQLKELTASLAPLLKILTISGNVMGGLFKVWDVIGPAGPVDALGLGASPLGLLDREYAGFKLLTAEEADEIRARNERARERAEDDRSLGERIMRPLIDSYTTHSEALRDDVEARRDTMAETVFSRITNDDFRELLGLTAEQVEISRRIVERTSLVTSPGAIGSEAP